MSVSVWAPDPTGRHQYRWWDGERWSDQVADDGVQTVDPVSTAEAQLPLDEPLSPPPPAADPEGAGAHPSPDPDDPASMLASKGRRFGAFLLDFVLVIGTLVIGYLVWALIVYSRGQTPAKQVLKMRVVSVESRRAAGWLSMFVREWILKVAIPIALNLITWGIGGTVRIAIGGITLLANDMHRGLWDNMMKTVVIDDPQNLFNPQSRNSP